MLAETGLELLDKLINYWSVWETNADYYLTILAPAIVRGDSSHCLSEREKMIVAKLRDSLSPEEWSRLPELITQRQAGTLKLLASDGQRKSESITAGQKRVRKLLAEANQRDEMEQVRRQQQHEASVRKEAARRKLLPILQSDFLGADDTFARDPDARFMGKAEYDLVKADFVREWSKDNTEKPLDQDQAAAVAATTGDIQVVARAGSGKTRTLVTRTIFLQHHCDVSPDKILLLAFNRSAAEHMMAELKSELNDHLPHVMTFHALAYALVHPEESLIYDDIPNEHLALRREVQEIVDEYVRSSEYSYRIRDLMLAHFRDDWEQIVDGKFQLPRDEFLAYRRSLPRESLGGDFIKSYGEKVIANALFEHDIEYTYEANYRWDGTNYRPDFMIRTGRYGGVIIEYFGLKGDPDYDTMSEEKREFWASQKGWKFLEFTPDDLLTYGAEGFTKLLIQELKAENIPCRRLSEDAIWEKVRARDPDCFSAAMTIFIQRCRKLNWSPEKLQRQAATHLALSWSEGEFIDIGSIIYRDYLDRLTSRGLEDFDGLMWEAIARIRAGKTRFIRRRGEEQGELSKLDFVMIDEFQDFTPAFAAMIDAIRSINPKVRFFGVGDDWQAINGFAGSDLKFFTDFHHYFQDASRLYIRTNYRSGKSIVSASNALMHGKGPGAKAHTQAYGRIEVYNLDEIQLSLREIETHHRDEITPAVLRLVRYFLDQGHDVVLLCRRNALPWYVDYKDNHSRRTRTLDCFLHHIRLYMPEEDRKWVRASTVHSYKGKESSAVILLDAVERSYPLIHPNWIFYRVFGDKISSIEEEERRLFYVAITRAKHALAIITETDRQSPYLADIHRHYYLHKAPWAALPPMPALDGEYVTISVWGAFLVKESLKKQGYRWNRQSVCWQKSVRRKGFSFEEFQRTRSWIRSTKKVEIHTEGGTLLHSIGN